MPKKCRSCGAKVIEYPIWKGQEHGEPFAFNKIRWYNLLIGDWTKLLILLLLLLVIWAYSNDTQECREILEHPCDFIKTNQQTCYEIERQKNDIKDIPFEPILLPDIKLELE